MNILEAMNAVISASPLSKADIARLEGVSYANMANMLSPSNRKDMAAGKAARILGMLGYDLVLVPRGKRLPDGCIVVDGGE